jgi:FkbM family methyltransferase
VRQRDCRTKPTSAHPLNVIAYAATRAGSVLGRTLGMTGFNSVRRLTGDALASQMLQAIYADGVILFPALDTYCCTQFIEGIYEPEVYRFLAAVRDEPYAFIDGGANLGYWSVQVSGRVLGSHPCLAIEASASTFKLLELNRVANGDRFQTLHAALASTSGTLLHVDESVEHAARRAIAEGGRGSSVVSVTVDDAVERFPPGTGTVIVKLDIEGAEPDALAGARRTRSTRDCLFIVEDHGSDDSHRTSAACFAEGLLLWHLAPSGVATPMPDLSAVARTKVARHTGYNFVAFDARSALADRLGLTDQRRVEGRRVQLGPVAAS